MILRRWARYPWAAMTHLTPSKMDVILNPNYGFRERSNAIARNVSDFLSFKSVVFHSGQKMTLLYKGSHVIWKYYYIKRTKCPLLAALKINDLEPVYHAFISKMSLILTANN